MINGNTIVLKEITDNHTDLILKWRNSETVRRNFIFQDILTKEMHTRWLRERVDTGEVVQFIIYIADNMKPIGTVYLRDIDYTHNKAEFGIYIGEDTERGHGYGHEATELICEYGFAELKLNKIYLRVLAQNEIAKKTYEKAGFRQEALFKQDVRVNGEYLDVIFMAKFAGDKGRKQ